MPTKAIRSRRLTPAALLAVAVRELKRRGSPERAAGGKAYFKKSEPVHLYGVPVPQVRALARTLLADVRSTWTVADAIGFANLAVKKKEIETKMLGFFLLANYAADLPADFTATVEGWIKKGLVGNWALIDTLSAEVITPLIKRWPVRLGKKIEL